MKTKLEHLKEHWLLAFISNLPIAFIGFTISRSLTDKWYTIVLITLTVWVISTSNNLKDWYTEDKMKELEERIEKLEND